MLEKNFSLLFFRFKNVIKNQFIGYIRLIYVIKIKNTYLRLFYNILFITNVVIYIGCKLLGKREFPYQSAVRIMILSLKH